MNQVGNNRMCNNPGDCSFKCNGSYCTFEPFCDYHAPKDSRSQVLGQPEETIRVKVRILEIQACLKAIEFRVAGMSFENSFRLKDGCAVAYPYSEFGLAESETLALVAEARDIIKCLGRP